MKEINIFADTRPSSLPPALAHTHLRFTSMTRKWRLGVWNKLRASFANDPDPLANVSYESSRIALHENKILACAIVTTDGYLQYLYVNEDMRGRGLGRTLLRECMPFIQYLHCDVALERFYTKFAPFQVSKMQDGRLLLTR